MGSEDGPYVRWFRRSENVPASPYPRRVARAVRAYDQALESGRADDLQLAIALLHRGLPRAFSPPPAEVYACCHLLCLALQKRFQDFGDPHDITTAVDFGADAVEVAAPGQPTRSPALIARGQALLLRYECFGKVDDLTQALVHLREAIGDPGADQEDRLSGTQVLGGVLRLLFQRTGDPAMIAEAVALHRQALNDPVLEDRWTAMGNLAAVLRIRFESRRRASDLDEAISLCEAVAAEADPAFRHYSPLHSEWALSLCLRYELVQPPDGRPPDDLRAAEIDARHAVRAAETAQRTAGEDAENTAMALANLARALRRRGEATGSEADFERAASAADAALRMTPAGHPKRARRLAEYGIAAGDRYERSGEPGHLREAVRSVAGAAEMVLDSPEYAYHLVTLGTLLRKHALATLAPADALASMAVLRRAAEAKAAPTSVRLLGAANWAISAHSLNDDQALDGYRAYLDLLSVNAWRGADRRDQERELRHWAGPVLDSAAYAVEQGDPRLAAGFLEQGRGVLWTQTLDIRTDTSDLARRHPDIAARLGDIRRQLDGGATEASPPA